MTTQVERNTPQTHRESEREEVETKVTTPDFMPLWAGFFELQTKFVTTVLEASLEWTRTFVRGTSDAFDDLRSSSR
jgi:hypothetical protein